MFECGTEAQDKPTTARKNGHLPVSFSLLRLALIGKVPVQALCVDQLRQTLLATA